MKSRQNFEGRLSAEVQERIKTSTNPQEEALWMIDLFLSAGFFCAGVIERGSSTERQINCLFTRAQRVREEIERGKRAGVRSGNGGKPLHGIDGNPLILPP
jgi:hypothetical protein